MSILVGNVLPKSIQVSFIDKTHKGSNFYDTVRGTSIKVPYGKEVDCLDFSSNINTEIETPLILSSIGPFSYRNTAFLEGFLKGAKCEYILLDWKKICLHIRKIFEIENRTPEPMSKDFINSYIDTHSLLKLEKIKYIDTTTNRSRYADAIAFYYFQEYLLNE